MLEGETVGHNEIPIWIQPRISDDRKYDNTTDIRDAAKLLVLKPCGLQKNGRKSFSIWLESFSRTPTTDNSSFWSRSFTWLGVFSVPHLLLNFVWIFVWSHEDRVHNKIQFLLWIDYPWSNISDLNYSNFNAQTHRDTWKCRDGICKFYCLFYLTNGGAEYGFQLSYCYLTFVF